MSDKLEQLRLQLAEAMTEQDEAEKAQSEVMATVEAEFARVFQRVRDAKAHAKAIEESARVEIESYFAETGEKPDVLGFGVQQRETVEYDTDDLIAWAVIHQVSDFLSINDKAVKDFVAKCQKHTNPDTGEVEWLYFSHLVPVVITHKAGAVIQRKALLTWLDEQRFNSEREAQS